MRTFRSFWKLALLIALVTALAACRITDAPSAQLPPSQTPGVDVVRDANGNLVRIGRGTLNDAVYSPDDRLIAVASSIGVYLYDAQTLALVRYLPSPGWVDTVIFSPDGQRIAAGAHDDTARVWRVSDGALIWEFTGHPGPVRVVAFSPDLALLATAGEYGSVRLWRISDGALVHSIEVQNADRIYDMDFSPDGVFLAVGGATGSEAGIVQVWQVSDASLVREFSEPSSGEALCAIRRVAFSPGQEAMLFAMTDSDTGRLWRLRDGALLHTLSDVNGEGPVAFSRDGMLLITDASIEDARVRMWRVSDGAKQRDSRLTDDGKLLAFSHDGSRAITSSAPDRAQVWQMNDGKLAGEIHGHTQGMIDLALSQDILAASMGDTIWLWRLIDGSPLTVFTTGYRYRIASDVALSPDGTLLAASVGEALAGDAYLWRISDGEEVRVISGEMKNPVVGVDFSPDQVFLATRSYGGNIRLWLLDGSMERSIASDDAASLAFSSDGALLATGGYRSVDLWRAADQGRIRSFALPGQPEQQIESVHISANGVLLAAGGFAAPAPNRTIGVAHIWRLQDGVLLHTLTPHNDFVAGVLFNPDGTLLATLGGWDHIIRLWRTHDGTLHQELIGHTALVQAIAFTPDGKRLISASSDGTIRFWDVR